MKKRHGINLPIVFCCLYYYCKYNKVQKTESNDEVQISLLNELFEILHDK